MENPRLKFIKELHDEATEKAPSHAYSDIDRVRDILSELFYGEHTDWLIEQAQKVERYEKALKEIERWDKMLYSPRELGNFAKKALGLPIIPLKD